MIKYSLGFLFSFEKEKVVLIRKLRPHWQKGKLNGVGGKVEEGETSLQCMIREFSEEVNYTSNLRTEWHHFAVLNGPDYCVDCFTALGDLSSVKSKTDELIKISRVSDISPLRRDMVSNLPSLISLAIDYIEDGNPNFSVLNYK